MADQIVVYVGAAAPEAVQFDIAAGGIKDDLSDVTSVTVLVTQPDGTTATWTASIITQSATAITASYAFSADGTDVEQEGTVNLQVRLWVNATLYRTIPKKLKVIDPSLT